MMATTAHWTTKQMAEYYCVSNDHMVKMGRRPDSPAFVMNPGAKKEHLRWPIPRSHEWYEAFKSTNTVEQVPVTAAPPAKTGEQLANELLAKHGMLPKERRTPPATPKGAGRGARAAASEAGPAVKTAARSGSRK